MKRYFELVPGILAALVVIGAVSLGLFSGPERFFEDILFSKQPIRSDIAIIAIDNKSLSAIGQWPWQREVFGNLLARLQAVSPKAVGIDVIFAEPSRYGQSDDEKLLAALKKASYPVVMPVEADPLVFTAAGVPEAKELVMPRALFDAPTLRLAHVNLITDPDSVVRTIPLAIQNRADGMKIPSFANAVSHQEPQDWTARIAYVGPPGTIPRVSFIDALESTSTLAMLAGKYVLVGATATDLHDEQITPFSRGIPMSGVEIQAQAMHMLLENDTLVPLARGSVMLWIFFAALIPAILFILIRSTKRALLASVLVSLVHIPIVIVLFDQGIIGNIIHVNLAWILSLGCVFSFRHFVLEKEKREMRHVFSKYVSKDVLEDILRDTTKVRLGGEERESTVFFSDVRGFTTLSEKLTPMQLTQFLNRYLTVMTEIALEHRGVVDKYIGDAIMVFWGAPLENKRHVLDAMESSLIMIEALHRFNAESVAAGDPPIDIGIGFNSGRVIAGNMGSEQRFDYTVMGDTVNLASRLEGQTKTYGIHIITSEFTIALTTPEELKANGFVVREIDRIRVKGKKLPVTIYELIERARIDAVASIREQFDALRVAYYKGDWDTAISLGEAILTKTTDGPTNVLLERARHFKEEPPENWEGVYEFKTK